MKRFLVRGINGQGREFEIQTYAETEELARWNVQNIAEAFGIQIECINNVTEI